MGFSTEVFHQETQFFNQETRFFNEKHGLSVHNPVFLIEKLGFHRKTRFFAENPVFREKPGFSPKNAVFQP